MAMTRLKLIKVANVLRGISFRSGVEVAAEGNLRLVQMRDLSDHLVSLKSAVSIDYTVKKIDNLIRPGDILFRARGQKPTAAIYEGREGQAIMAAPLLLVRPNTEFVFPRYLLWWLNQPRSQYYFASHAEGSAVQMISRRCLERLEVALPPLDRQRTIAAYFNLAEREGKLLGSIQRQRASHAHVVLMHLAKTEAGADNNNLEAGTVAALPPQLNSDGV